jgi:hypothetical protein
MDKIVEGLGPAFAAGFAVQQLLEILDPILDKVKVNKKLFLGLISLIVGFALASGARLHVLQAFGVVNAGFWDIVVTGLIISGGTEGFNSIMKYMGYSKDNAKKNLESSEDGRPATNVSLPAARITDVPPLGADTLPN